MNKSYLTTNIPRHQNTRFAMPFLPLLAVLLLGGFNSSTLRASCPEILLVNELPAGAIGYVILNLDGDTLAFRPYGGPAPACQLTVGETYIIHPFRPYKDMDWVTTYDMIETQRHLLGTRMLGFPQRIAADVNKSASVTISDILFTRDFILDPGKELENRLSWEFLREDLEGGIPYSPGVLGNGLFVYTGPGQVIPYIAIKIGRTRTTEKYFYPGYPMEGTVVFEVEDISLIPGQTYEVPVRAIGFNDMNGFQFAMDMESSGIEFMGINGGSLFLYYGEPSEGLVTTHWMSHYLTFTSLSESETAFSIQIKANKSGKLSQFMQLNPNVMLAQAYDGTDGFWNIALAYKSNFNGTKGSGMSGVSAPVDLENSSPFSGGNAGAATRFDDGNIATFKLHDAMPNPLRERTRIGLTVPEKGEVQWLILDVQGKAVVEEQQQVNSGINELIWEASGMTPGMYFISVQYAGQTRTQTLMVD
jgi:hypothetical protein